MSPLTWILIGMIIGLGIAVYLAWWGVRLQARRFPPSGQDKLITDPPPLAKPGQVTEMLNTQKEV